VGEWSRSLLALLDAGGTEKEMSVLGQRSVDSKSDENTPDAVREEAGLAVTTPVFEDTLKMFFDKSEQLKEVL
jgi:hypothetical protein